MQRYANNLTQQSPPLIFNKKNHLLRPPPLTVRSQPPVRTYCCRPLSPHPEEKPPPQHNLQS